MELQIYFADVGKYSVDHLSQNQYKMNLLWDALRMSRRDYVAAQT